MKTYREFDTIEEARTYRHEHGTGGWIFEPENGGPVILFPPHMSPAEIFYHPITGGQAGNLIGAA